jgi:hypothetical protein
VDNSPSKRFQPRYVDYGKIFLKSKRGAFEYSALDRSDNEIVSISKDLYLSELATFAKKAVSFQKPARSDLGEVTVAMIKWGNDNLFYIQVQRRYENEFAPLGTAPLTNRAFNQVRLTYLAPDDIIEFFCKQKIGLYSSLLYSKEGSKRPGMLKDYIDPQRGKISEWNNIEYNEVSLVDANIRLLRDIVNSLYIASRSKTEAIQDIDTRKWIVIAPNLSLSDKLRLIDAIQYFMFPILGVITFALDYITDRAVLFYLLDESPKSGPASKAQYLDLKKSSATNYWETMSHLPPEQLFHKTLAYYLKTNLDPNTALELFRLIETDYSYTEKEEIDLLQNHANKITADHWRQIIKRRFSPESKIIRLLRILPTRLRLDILKQIMNSLDQDLARYAPYHITAITELDGDPSTEKEFRTILRNAIQNSSAGVLKKIPDNLKLDFFKELILTDFEFRTIVSSTHPNQPLIFKPEMPGVKNARSVTSLVMELTDGSTINRLANPLPSNLRDFSVREILGDIDKGQSDWSISQALALWTLAHSKTPNLFTKLLKLIVKEPRKFPELAKNPLEIKFFLLNGRNILLGSQNQAKQSSEREKLSVLTLLRDFLLDDYDLTVSSLRKACIEIGRYNSGENVSFASWWLLSEISYTNSQIIREDYAELLNNFQANLTDEFPGSLREAIYLLSGGAHFKMLSLHEACKQFKNDKPVGDLNELLFMSAIEVWQERKIVIPNRDIAFLVNRLPDPTSNLILAKIVLDATRSQIAEIQDLPEMIVLLWLQKTEKKLRNSYLSESGDLLLDTLIGAKNLGPTLMRYAIVDDPSSYPDNGDWSVYKDHITRLYLKYSKLTSPDRYTQDYLNLAQNFTDRAKNGARNRLVLKRIVEWCYADPNEDLDIHEKLLLVLLLYSKTENAKSIQERVDLVLTRYIQGSAFGKQIGALSDHTFHFLYQYISQKEPKISEKHVRDIFVNEEIRRRQGNITRP